MDDPPRNSGPARCAEDPGSTPDRIRVVVIEDNCVVRQGITTLLGRFPDLEVVATDTRNHSTLLVETAPEVLLLNVGVVGGESLEFVRTLGTRHPGLRILLMDLLPAREDLVDFIAAGVWGFIHRNASVDDVRGTIQAVSAGLKVIPDEITGTLFGEIARKSVASDGAEDLGSARLTPREIEVMDLVAEGMSNKAIGRRLRISLHTVKSHLRGAMDKLGMRSRLQIARYVRERGNGVQLPAAQRRRRKGAQPAAGPTGRRSTGKSRPRSGATARRRYSRPGVEGGDPRFRGRS
jgi:DNA-binding NarL/FixJ family response regulator